MGIEGIKGSRGLSIANKTRQAQPVPKLENVTPTPKTQQSAETRPVTYSKTGIVDPAFTPTETTARGNQETGAIIDPLFKPGSGNGGSEIVDPAFKPSEAAAQQGSKSIIDPLFKGSGNGSTEIVDPAFKTVA